jgi:peroxiredoxin
MPESTPAPLTVEGSAVLHQMFRFRWREWRALPGWQRERMIRETVGLLQEMEQGQSDAHPNQSAIYSQLGHKGDLLLIHFRDSLEDLNDTELELARLEFFDYLEPRHSYVSIIELGLYDSSTKAFGVLREKGVEPHSPEWNEEIKQVLARQAGAMAPRLFLLCRPQNISAFIPWTKSAEKP